MQTAPATSSTLAPPSGVSQERWLKQLALEQEMHDLGVTRYRNKVQRLVEDGLEAQSKYGKDLMAGSIDLVVQALKEWRERLKTRGAGRHGIASKYLDLIEPETAAFIGLKVILDSISLSRTLVNTAYKIGATIEDELKFRHFEKQEPGLFKHIMKHSIEGQTSYLRKEQALSHRMKAYKVTWEDWPHTDKIHLGIKLIDFTIAATGIIEIGGGERVGKRQNPLKVVATPKTLDWISRYHNFWEVLDPVFLPTLIRPKPWQDVWDGGYWTPKVGKLRLVKKRNTNYLKDLAQEDLSRVFSAINALQDTAWKINQRVLEVAKVLWDRGYPVADLPDKNQKPLPTKPDDIATNKESLRAWKLEAKAVYKYNAQIYSRCIQTSKILWLAEKFKTEEEFYYPYQCDFRGRTYAVPMFLNPQGNDLARSLIHFANGKPLGDEMASYWLAIHGANCFGYDKVTLEDRVIWSEDHTAEILAVCKDPTNNLWWSEADKPWQFLAFCFEWEGYKNEGLEWVNRVPIALDGSCNGLQHFSAMLRDEVGGKAVNLIPTELPQDIYQEVAEVVKKNLSAPWREGWERFVIDRKITKRPVMVLPYGGTRWSCEAYVEEAVREKIAGGLENPFGERVGPAIRDLSKTVWTSIGQVVIAAVEAMDWLKKIAQCYNKAGLPIIWKTPVGFVVYQKYKKRSFQRIKVYIAGCQEKQWWGSDSQEPDPREQVNGISPNFVHSMDAAAMQICVNDCLDAGFSGFSMIHDSFGTLAADTSTIAGKLRAAFVHMYTENDPIESIYRDCVDRCEGQDIPEKPASGTLDLNQTIESRFFFS